MSDKEFDKQFKDSFEEFEVPPSSFIWNEIERDLKKTQKKSFPWFKVAAASVAAVLAAGIWFAPHKEPMKLYGKAKTEEVELKADDVQLPEVKALQQPEDELTIIEEKRSFTFKRSSKIVASKANVHEEKMEIPASGQKNDNLNQVTAATSIETMTVQQTLGDALGRVKASQDMLAFNSLQEDTTLGKSKHKIRSVGDLVNFVVSKVDRRKNKLIEFSKDDEGEEISGLNLGLLQYRTRDN